MTLLGCAEGVAVGVASYPALQLNHMDAAVNQDVTDAAHHRLNRRNFGPVLLTSRAFTQRETGNEVEKNSL